MRRVALRLVTAVQGTALWRAAGSPVRRALVVRCALAGPARGWRSVYPELAGDPARERRLAHAFIASCGPLALGGLLLHPFEHGLFASALRVRPLFRGWGVGTRLAKFARSRGEAERCAVWLVVSEENVIARALWQQAGFGIVAPPTPVDRPGHLVLRAPAPTGSAPPSL